MGAKVLKALQWATLVVLVAGLIGAVSIASVAVALLIVSKTPAKRNYLKIAVCDQPSGLSTWPYYDRGNATAGGVKPPFLA
jgi:hypothetical protein